MNNVGIFFFFFTYNLDIDSFFVIFDILVLYIYYIRQLKTCFLIFIKLHLEYFRIFFFLFRVI